MGRAGSGVWEREGNPCQGQEIQAPGEKSLRFWALSGPLLGFLPPWSPKIPKILPFLPVLLLGGASLDWGSSRPSPVPGTSSSCPGMGHSGSFPRHSDPSPGIPKMGISQKWGAGIPQGNNPEAFFPSTTLTALPSHQ